MPNCMLWMLVLLLWKRLEMGTHARSVEEVKAPIAEVIESWETTYLKTGWRFIEGDLAGWTASAFISMLGNGEGGGRTCNRSLATAIPDSWDTQATLLTSPAQQPTPLLTGILTYPPYGPNDDGSKSPH